MLQLLNATITLNKVMQLIKKPYNVKELNYECEKN